LVGGRCIRERSGVLVVPLKKVFTSRQLRFKLSSFSLRWAVAAAEDEEEPLGSASKLLPLSLVVLPPLLMEGNSSDRTVVGFFSFWVRTLPLRLKRPAALLNDELLPRAVEVVDEDVDDERGDDEYGEDEEEEGDRGGEKEGEGDRVGIGE
jgi:hypothetical protein